MYVHPQYGFPDGVVYRRPKYPIISQATPHFAYLDLAAIPIVTRFDPFGHHAYNGLNFSRSISNPKSRLAKVVKHIRCNGPTSKYNLILALGFLHQKNDQMIRAMQMQFGDVVRDSHHGWASGFFTLARKCKFLEYNKSTRMWSLGVNAKYIKT